MELQVEGRQKVSKRGKEGKAPEKQQETKFILQPSEMRACAAAVK